MKKIITLTLLTVLSAVSATQSFANTPSSEGQLTLAFSDGRTAVTGVEDVNKVLHNVGVRVSTLPIPKEAGAIIDISKQRAITANESAQLISMFSLHRGQLLDQIEKAGRKPEAHRGGLLVTSEEGVAPYPKVYDMKAMTPEVKDFLAEKFGKLHVNSADNGMGIDEVMTIVSGGSMTWFFRLPDDVVGKLTLGYVSMDGQAWRISYPGLGPHGALLNSEHGLVVAYTHGPKNFVMRYDEPSVEGTKTLGTNPWIDLTGERPQLLD